MGKVLIFGEPKVAGKSTLAMGLDPEHTIALDVEDGLSAIEGYKHRITSWSNGHVTGEGRTAQLELDDHSFRGTIKMLHEQRADHPFRIGVLDTADALAFLCAEYVLSSLGRTEDNIGQFVHASDFDFGKGWEAIRSEWQLRIGALCRVLDSVILISHADRKTEKDRIGAEFPVYTPALAPKGIRAWTLGFVDWILLARVERNDAGEDVHCVRTQPAQGWDAGGRTVAGGPKLPDPLWLPDPVTAGATLRKELEAVSAPPKPTAESTGDPKPKPKAKTKAAPKPAAQEKMLA